MGKILIILSIVVSLASAGVGYLNRTTLLQTKETLASTQADLEKTKSELEETKKKLTDSEAEKTVLTAKLEQTESQVAKLKTELATTQTNLTEANTKLTEKTAEIATLTTDLKTKGDEIEALKVAVAAATAASTAAPVDDEKQTRITELEGLNKTLSEELESKKAALADYKQKENEAKLKYTRKNLMGRILAVNQAWNFVVLSIGDKNGVLSNTELIVKRGSTEIGRVRITSVEPSTSIADIIPTSITRGLSIQPGDEVIFKNPEE
jgi:DNA repair exonuclease SbcCD ATPase subunit